MQTSRENFNNINSNQKIEKKNRPSCIFATSRRRKNNSYSHEDSRHLNDLYALRIRTLRRGYMSEQELLQHNKNNTANNDAPKTEYHLTKLTKGELEILSDAIFKIYIAVRNICMTCNDLILVKENAVDSLIRCRRRSKCTKDELWSVICKPVNLDNLERNLLSRHNLRVVMYSGKYSKINTTRDSSHLNIRLIQSNSYLY